jgi:NHLM bacteriocin system ABC transporter peptidase/ATP-binding protein
MSEQFTRGIPSRRRARVPSVLQMEMLECGAACLGMVLGHFGQHVPLMTLRDESQVSRDGATALQIAKVARNHGLSAKGKRLELAELHTIATPFIAHWGFNHFVVVEGWNRKGVFLNDPASGPRMITWRQMDREFTGVAIEFGVTHEFEKSKKPPSVLGRLTRMLEGFRWPLVFATLLGVLYAFPGIATAGFMAFFINTILGQQQLGLAPIFLIGILIAIILQLGFGWLQTSTLARTSVMFSTSLAAELGWRILRLPMRYFTQRSAGEVAYRMNMPSTLAAQLAGPLPRVLISAFSVLLYFAAMALISLWAAATALIVGTLNFLLLRFVSRKQREGEELLLQEQGKLLGETTSALANIEFIKSTGAEDESFNRFTAFQAKVINTRQSLLWLTTIVNTVPNLLSLLASAAVIAIGAFAVLNGTLGIGGLVALQILMAGFLAPFITFVQLGSSINNINATLVKIDDVLEQEPAVSGIRMNAPAVGEQGKLIGKIEFRDVTFGYNKSAPPLLDALSFTVEPGHRIAFVGTSGAGKSTIAKLLCGLEQPWSGSIYFDGVPRAEITETVINASLSLVDQSVVLFPGTVMENLTLWDESIPVERAIAAARAATIHEVIAARPDGYDAVVLEGARNFSGGQSQRIEIARALAIDPSILVLDEATSALDAATEVAIDNAIRQRGCTTVVIAHRISTIRDADVILVLDRGVVVQSGTHDELVASGGLYRSLVES